MAKRDGEYRDQNPKIDLYAADGTYLCSTKWYSTCRAALARYKKNGAAKASIDHRRTKKIPPAAAFFCSAYKDSK